MPLLKKTEIKEDVRMEEKREITNIEVLEELVEKSDTPIPKETQTNINNEVIIISQDAPVEEDSESEELNEIIDDELEKIRVQELSDYESVELEQIINEAFVEDNSENTEEDWSDMKEYFDNLRNEKILESSKNKECEGCKVLTKAIDNIFSSVAISENFIKVRESQVAVREDILNGRNEDKLHHQENHLILKSISKGMNKFNLSMMAIVAIFFFILGGISWENKVNIKEFGKPFVELMGFANKVRIGDS